MRRLLIGSLVLAVGCAPMQVERRTERGPLLRTYSKDVVLGQRTVAADVEVRWPRLALRFVASDACRTETHEEYAEELITERYEPSAAPALAGGLANALLGGGLLLARPLFSNEPDRDAIDRQGRYGASDRRIATNWGVALVALGLPALITGTVQMLRSGEERETRKVDTVASVRDTPCRPEPASGMVQFVGGAGESPPPRLVEAGGLELGAEELRGMAFNALLLDETPVALSDEDAVLLDGFRACAEVQGQPMDAEALGQLPAERLVELRALAVRCAAIPGAPAEEWGKALDTALAAVLEREGPALEPEPQLRSFEDALATYKPELHLSAGSPDVERLRKPEALAGKAVFLVGVLTQRQDPDTAVVEVGGVRVLVSMDPKRAWASDFPRGTRVELVGVVHGAHPLGGAQVPLVRAMWMRQAL